ncbi:MULTISPECIES: hypothetical protein [Bacillaceae]|uniref:Uncharacterized protein n=1 Tax=Evansella alkalicola TaxID=745819 RepID=A0ABS6JR39_9BACI|nr:MULTISPECIES: hypothetical protein [Bacillaceae]MBU9721031.1 hypothetical protein [Bacillus alkalicola]
MIKKMLRRILVTFLIICIVIIAFHLSTKSLRYENFDADTKNVVDEDYFYFISDSEVVEAIELGMAAADIIDQYIIPYEPSNSSENKVKEDTSFAFIETPFLTTVNLARKTFHQFGREVLVSEVKGNLNHNFLPLHVRFEGNKGYVYDIILNQENREIEPVKVEKVGNGGMTTVTYLTDDIDFTKEAILKVVDPLNPSQRITFRLDFRDYR